MWHFVMENGANVVADYSERVIVRLNKISMMPLCF